LLDCFKSLLSNARPHEENSLFQQLSERATNDAIIFDKVHVIPYQPQETPQLFDIGWHWPLIDNSNLGWICDNDLSSDDMTKVFQRLLCKKAFAFFNE
jgi:hypothetical protein